MKVVKTKKLPHKQIVANHFLNSPTITSWEAITKYRITRLAAVINILVHKDGQDITGQWHYDQDGVKDYYIYTKH